MDDDIVYEPIWTPAADAALNRLYDEAEAIDAEHLATVANTLHVRLEALTFTPAALSVSAAPLDGQHYTFRANTPPPGRICQITVRFTYDEDEWHIRLRDITWQWIEQA